MKLSIILLMICLVFVTLPGCGNRTTVEYLSSPAIEKLNLPFSEAVRVNNMLYLSGQIGFDPKQMTLVEGGVEKETQQTLENIKSTLERYGVGLDDVVKCTVFLLDIAEWPRVNEVYKTYFKSPYPARSAVAGSGLAYGARVEIECIAVLK